MATTDNSTKLLCYWLTYEPVVDLLRHGHYWTCERLACSLHLERVVFLYGLKGGNWQQKKARIMVRAWAGQLR